MDVLIANSAGYALGYLTQLTSFDVDTTQSYDFEMQIPLSEYSRQAYDFGHRVYCPGTEFGGVISDVKIVSSEANVIVMGDTWRGMLRKKIICPPDGQAYRVVSGEANSIISSLLGNRLGSLFAVSDADSGFTVTSYQFARYVTMEEGICAMLRTVGAKLSIIYDSETATVTLSAQPSVLHTDYSDDLVHLTARQYHRGINHLICLGQGELEQRTRIDLYVGSDGSIGNTRYYTGLNEREEVYDYSAAESVDVLESYGRKRLQELMDYETATLDVEDITDMGIGDVVEATETMTGLTVRAYVIGLTLTISHGFPTITYKIGDEST